MPAAARGQGRGRDSADSVTLSANGADWSSTARPGSSRAMRRRGVCWPRAVSPISCVPRPTTTPQRDRRPAIALVHDERPLSGAERIDRSRPERDRRSRDGGGRGALRHPLQDGGRRGGRCRRAVRTAEGRSAAAGPHRPVVHHAHHHEDGEWYGRGPHESYVDRKTSAAIGLWRGSIAEQNHDYMRPQDTATSRCPLDGAVGRGGGASCSRAETADDAGARLPLWRPLPPGAGDMEVDRYRAAWRDDADRRCRAMGCRRRHDLEPCRPAASAISHHLAPTRVAFRLEPFSGDGTTPDKAKPARATEVQ